MSTLEAVEVAIGCYAFTAAPRADLTAAALFAEVDAWIVGGGGGGSGGIVSGRLMALPAGSGGGQAGGRCDFGTGAEGALEAMRQYRFYAAVRDASGNTSALRTAAATTADTTRPTLSAPSGFSVAQDAGGYYFSVAAAGGVTASDNVSGALRAVLVLSSAPLSAGELGPAISATGKDVLASLTVDYGTAPLSLAGLRSSKFYDCVSGLMRDIDETAPLAPFALYPLLVAVDASGNTASLASAPVTVTVRDWTPATVTGGVSVTQSAVGAPNPYLFTLAAPCALSDGRSGSLSARLLLADAALNADELAAAAAAEPAEAAAALSAGAYPGSLAPVALAGLAAARYYRAAAAGFADIGEACAALVPHVLALDPDGNVTRAAGSSVAVADRTAPVFAGFTGGTPVTRTVQLTWAAASDGRSALSGAGPALTVVAFTSEHASLTAAELMSPTVLSGYVSSVTVPDARAATRVIYGSGALGEAELAEGVLYHFYGSAADAAGNASAVYHLAAATADVSAPDLPWLTAGNTASYSVPLSWGAVADNLDASPDLVIAAYTAAQPGITAAQVLAGEAVAAAGQASFVSKVRLADAAASTTYSYGSGALGEAALAPGTGFYFVAVAEDAAGNAGAPPLDTGRVETQIVFDTSGQGFGFFFDDADNVPPVDYIGTLALVRLQTTAGSVIYDSADKRQGARALNNYSLTKAFAKKNFVQLNRAPFNTATGFTISMWFKTNGPVGNCSSNTAGSTVKIFGLLSGAGTATGTPAITSIGSVKVSISANASANSCTLSYFEAGGTSVVIVEDYAGVDVWNNAWHLLTLVNSPAALGNYTTLYVDGVARFNRAGGAAALLNNADAQRCIRVGFDGGGLSGGAATSGTFNAKMDDLRFYTRALNAQYVTALYNRLF